MVDARAAQKFNHFRFLAMGEGLGTPFTAADTPNLAYFHKLDERVRYINQKGLTADLILAGTPLYLFRNFPYPEDRRKLVRFLAGRYAGMNVTWQIVQEFEGYPNSRDLLREVGGLLKEMDGYHHPRSTGARVTSAPLLVDGWEDFAAYGTADDAVPAIEHQINPAPQVNVELGHEEMDAVAFRHRLWNATMDGQYVTYSHTAADPKVMSVWWDIMAQTRHWELEPFFDVDGGRGLALEDVPDEGGVEYMVYIEKPGPIEATVDDHSYNVYWIDPSDGAVVVGKKFRGEHFTGEPPDRYHDWVLHIVREGTLQSMNRSYYFDSKDVQMQEVEVNPAKIPFDAQQPSGDSLSIARPTPYAATVKKTTRATRIMMWLWTGEVHSNGQGYRVLATGSKGSFTLPPDLTAQTPASLLLKLYCMNAYGKVYLVDKGFELTQ
jgi:hypothetical protein